MLTLHPTTYTHTVADLMAKFLSDNNRSNIWQKCPPKSKTHQAASPPAGLQVQYVDYSLVRTKKTNLDVI